MKKAIIIAGQTGVGKTNIAYNLANKLNSEIVCIDTIQLYKDLKICANRPSIFLTNNIKYHNLNILEFNQEINGSIFANRTREIIKNIWSQNKIPILEGGCGFYLKMILTGGSQKFSDEEEKEYKKFSRIAKEIIRYDNNFEKSFERIIRLDKTTPEYCVTQNDLYRLEKKLTDVLMFGDGAYEMIKNREEISREKNKIDGEFYNFFLYCERNNLRKKLEQRCEKMIQDGLLNEVSDLLKDKKISPQMIIDKNSLFLNAYGIQETLKYFIEILKISHMKKDYLKAYEDKHPKKDKIKNKMHRQIEKIFYNFLNDFSTSNRQYAKRQATWFKSNEDYLWMDSENGEEKIVNEILNKINTPYEEYKNILNSDDYKEIKNSYFNSRVKKYNSIFDMMKNRQHMKKLIEKSFEYVELNKNLLKEIEKCFEMKNGKNCVEDKTTKYNNNDNNDDSSHDEIDVELLKKYLNM